MPPANGVVPASQSYVSSREGVPQFWRERLTSHSLG